MAKHHSRKPTTAATQVLDRMGIAYELDGYENQVSHEYGAEAAEALGVDPECVFKTLVSQLDNGDLVVAIVPVSMRLSFHKLAKAMGSKRAKLADPSLAERKTGYVVGGISPLGQRTKLRKVINTSALDQEKIWVSGGRRGVDIVLAPADLVRAAEAQVADIAAD